MNDFENYFFWKQKKNMEQEASYAEIADLFYRIFQALQVAGFEREEAFDLLLAIIYSNKN